ncbi:MAG: hypothetical protein QXP70_02770 [Methanomassiliicoccales archaeon]
MAQMKQVPVFTDREVNAILSSDNALDEIISEVEEFMRDKRKGMVVSPQRFLCETGDGDLVITAGGSLRKRIIGLRAYNTFGVSDAQQLTAVYSMDGELMGLFIGRLLGEIRTAAINAVAVKYLSKHSAGTLMIIGAGRQARNVLPAVCHVRDFRRVLVSSLHPEHAEGFVKNMQQCLGKEGIDISVPPSAEEGVRLSDVIITCTTSTDPVIRTDWIGEGQHVTTMGRKFKEAHEIEPSLLSRADIVSTDSLRQINGFAQAFMAGEEIKGKIAELSEFVDGAGRNDKAVSVFLSVGLAGTEVAVAGRLLAMARRAGVEASLMFSP